MKLKKFFEGNFTNIVLKYKYIIIVVVVGLLLVSFPSGKTEKEKNVRDNTVDFSLAEFEKRVENVLQLCQGVGKAKIVLTISSGPESVYAEEERRSLGKQKNGEISDETRDTDTKPSILSVGSGKEEAMLIKEIYPEFRGAVVVCEGAHDIKVCNEVISAVSSLTGLTSDKISVIKMKN